MWLHPSNSISLNLSTPPNRLGIKRMEFGTYLSTDAWTPKSQAWHGRLHGNAFWQWGLGLVLRVLFASMLRLGSCVNRPLSLTLHCHGLQNLYHPWRGGHLSPLLITFVLINHSYLEANLITKKWEQEYHHSNRFEKIHRLQILNLSSWGN